MIKYLDSIGERWRIARGEADGTEAAGSAGLTDGLAELLGDGTGGGNKPEAVDMGSLLTQSGIAEPVASGRKSADSFDFAAQLDDLK
jgi:hypothetical protein